MCIPVFVRAISSVCLSLVCFLVILVRSLKNDFRKVELIIGILICIAILVFSGTEFYNAYHPDIQTITASYTSSNRALHRLGFDYFFSDGNEIYCLYIDPITCRKYIGNNTLKIGEKYIILYETNEKMIISLKQVEQDQSGDDSKPPKNAK